MPKLYVTPDAQPNAFATGRNPDHAAVAVTQGILQICTWDELRGVLAHEISHVGNRDILISSVAATIAMAITLLARLAAWGGLFFGGGRDNQGANIFEVLALVILAPIAATLLQLALSRSREYEADRSGARLIGDGEPLARALAKLEAGGQADPHAAGPPRDGAPVHRQPAGRDERVVQGAVLGPPADGGADRPPALQGVGPLGLASSTCDRALSPGSSRTAGAGRSPPPAARR